MGDEVTVGCNRLAHVRRERPTAITAAKRQQFLDVVAATANVKRAAAAVGVDATQPGGVALGRRGRLAARRGGGTVPRRAGDR